ncbi:MAG: hypothetical protein WBA42_20760 [Mesorhizobium sp.]
MSLAIAVVTPEPHGGRPRDLPSSVVIVGLDDRGKPHASRFPVAAVSEVEAAASLMGMAVIKAKSEALAKIVEKLTVGKLFASGKAFVPFVSQDVYRQLEAYLPIALRKRGANKADGGSSADSGTPPVEAPNPDAGNAYAKAKSAGKPRSGKYPEDWDKITIGHIVLASDGREDGWWTACVREVRANGTYLLEWEEWAGFDRFVCRRDQIALLHPDYDGK